MTHPGAFTDSICRNTRHGDGIPDFVICCAHLCGVTTPLTSPNVADNVKTHMNAVLMQLLAVYLDHNVHNIPIVFSPLAISEQCLKAEEYPVKLTIITCCPHYSQMSPKQTKATTYRTIDSTIGQCPL